MLSELLHTFTAWLVILPSSFLAGTFYQRLVPPRDILFRGILYYALGIATLSYGVVVLSAVHLLATPYIWAMLLLPILIQAHKLKEWLQWLKELGTSLLPGTDLFSRVLFGLFAISFVCLLLGTLTPELGGDALCYQLNLPKVFLRQGSLWPDPLDYNSFFPLLMNNLFLIGLATAGVFAAKLFHFFCGFLLFLAIKGSLQAETKNYPVSLLVALAVFTTPTVYNLLSTAYIDVALAFYTFLAVILFMGALDSGKKMFFFLSGLLAGCAISTKYLALISFLGLSVVWFFSLIQTRRLREHLAGAGFFILGAGLVFGYWFARNGWMTGNPFFPYWGGFFGAETPLTFDFSKFGLGTSFFNFFSLYFNMFLSPAAFGTYPGRIGIFYFLFTPFIFLAMLFVPRSRGYVIFWLSFTSIIFFIAQADRWILPVLPVMALCAASGGQWFWGKASVAMKRVIKIGGGATAVAILCFYVAAGAYHYRYAYFLFTGKWDPRTYLLSLERTAGVAEWVNANLPRDSKILIDLENRIFYFDRPVIRQGYMSLQFNDPVYLNDPRRLVDLLKRQGVTHFLASGPLNDGSCRLTYSPLGNALRVSGSLKEIYAGESQNLREERFCYRLYRVGQS